MITLSAIELLERAIEEESNELLELAYEAGIHVNDMEAYYDRSDWVRDHCIDCEADFISDLCIMSIEEEVETTTLDWMVDGYRLNDDIIAKVAEYGMLSIFFHWIQQQARESSRVRDEVHQFMDRFHLRYNQISFSSIDKNLLNEYVEQYDMDFGVPFDVKRLIIEYITPKVDDWVQSIFVQTRPYLARGVDLASFHPYGYFIPQYDESGREGVSCLNHYV